MNLANRHAGKVSFDCVYLSNEERAASRRPRGNAVKSGNETFLPIGWTDPKPSAPTRS
ncbi:hypothetical protein GCM10010172_76750 [Paractinoplanes ferrugineus]|uniref:Uncharacterized protein n=1 Tax=Paractinoplanes ferrugineus TaxID=113564 RepID=A0A919J955_9ACTN|nr:hypothetical protein Afe05nite_82730 [Actinoplanes ferrugineus]